MKPVVFIGPTISTAEATAVLDAIYLPPVAQGDVYRATLQHPPAIGIIDGHFEHVPAVWHKEILWAMKEGIHVFGSASMGALRAAELHAFGMEGVGAIFEAYRDGTLQDDDEVAVRHGPAALGFAGSSEAMVNIRWTLEKAVREGALTSAAHNELVDSAKALLYPERSYPRVLELARAHGISEEQLTRFAAWLPAGRVNQKRLDAIAMLQAMRERLDDGLQPKRVRFSFEHTLFWEQAMAQARPASMPVARVNDVRSAHDPPQSR